MGLRMTTIGKGRQGRASPPPLTPALSRKGRGRDATRVFQVSRSYGPPLPCPVRRPALCHSRRPALWHPRSLPFCHSRSSPITNIGDMLKRESSVSSFRPMLSYFHRHELSCRKRQFSVLAPLPPHPGPLPQGEREGCLWDISGLSVKWSSVALPCLPCPPSPPPGSLSFPQV